MSEQQTPDREKKIAEIRETLEKATPGPWEYEMWEGCADVYPTTGKHVPICQLWTKTEEPMESAENNAHLIANAPEWLRFLLSELERLEREYAEERAAHNAHVTELCELEQERNMYKASSEVFYERLKKVWEERETLIECLRFYERKARGREANDGGRRARTLLAEIGVTVEPDRLHDARTKIAKARFSPERLISEREESGRCGY